MKTLQVIKSYTLPYRDAYNTPNDVEIPLEAQPVHIAWNNERQIFEMRFLIDPEMPEITRHFWWTMDGDDLEMAKPNGAEWDLSILGSVRLNEETVFHVIEGVE